MLLRLTITVCLLASGGLVNGMFPVSGAAPRHARPADAAEARRIVDELMQRAAIPGLQAAVAVDGQMVWSEGFGLANVELNVPVSPTTRFRIGSVSKTLTAAALATLVEKRQIDLDAEVQRYVPSFPDKGHRLTIRHLAGHLAGIRNYRGTEFINRTRYDTVADALPVFASDPLLFPPGTKYCTRRTTTRC